MRFLDLAKIHIRSGAGGSGSTSFRREKFVEFGGPDGGDGGDGGNVYAQAVPNLNTLIDFRYRRNVSAGNGQSGKGKQRTGASGKDVVLKVPIGTEILDECQSTVICDLTHSGQRELLAKGGKGGFGNRRFVSSTNQSPRIANSGQAGTELTIWLRLKLFADIGLLGLPNAGKSTLLAAVTNALPKIADYPFTTLHPVLGVLNVNGGELVLADIPGLIEGAHEGRGIGDRFLGHIERCAVLLHLVDATSDNIIDDYHTVIEEISNYGHGLAEKTRLTALSKIDAVSSADLRKKERMLQRHAGNEIFSISAFSRSGLSDCFQRTAALVPSSKSTCRTKSTWTP